MSLSFFVPSLFGPLPLTPSLGGKWDVRRRNEKWVLAMEQKQLDVFLWIKFKNMVSPAALSVYSDEL